MRGRKLRTGSLMALFAALILVLGAAPGLAQKKGIHSTKPQPKKFDYPHRANRVTIFFKKPLVAQGTEGKTTSITVQDACGRTLSNTQTQRATMEAAQPGDPVERAWVELDRRKKNPKGRYSVVVSYWLQEDEGGNSEDPNEEDPANQEPRIYEYWFDVHGGPNCDGSSGGGGNGHHNPKNKDKSWNGTGSSGHHGGDHTGDPNLRTAGSTSSTSDHDDHTDLPDLDSYTSPTFGDDDHTDHSTTTPFGDDEFGDPFGDTTGTSPLSDPTDPSLYESEAGQIPEEAADQQTLSAAPGDDLGPQSGTLVVALATALLLGAGGGLFLRKADPAPVRTRS
jgi:hypothetical protein